MAADFSRERIDAVEVGTAMKECPKCRQLYSLEDLRFCRFDGSRLINEGTLPHEAATILFSSAHLEERFASLEDPRRASESGKLS